MKQKGQDLTIVCSKRKQKVKTVVTQNDKTNDIKKIEIPNGIVQNDTKEFNNACSNEDNISVLPDEHSSSEKEDHKFHENSTVLEISQPDEISNDFSNENDVRLKENTCAEITEINDLDPTDKLGKEDTIITETEKLDSEEQSENQESDRMPSPSQKNQRNQLTTILENVKGEEKAVKTSQVNRTKVQSDNECKIEIHVDSYVKGENGSNEQDNMAQKRTIKTPSQTCQDTDSVFIKKTYDANKICGDKGSNRKANHPANTLVKQNGMTQSECDYRPSSSKSDPGSSRSSVKSKNSSSRTGRIYSGIRFTKQELEYYLPKRSNFSCHEKALRDAGLDVDAAETKRKQRLRQRHKARTEDKELEEKLKVIEDANAAPETMSSADTGNENKEIEEEQSEMERVKLEKNKRKGKKKGEEIEIKVDHTVLLQYLKYVLENQDEYLVHKRQVLQQSSWLNYDPECTIARFGRIFQRGQHGSKNENFLLEVTRGIKSNFGDSAQWIPPSKDKNAKMETTNNETSNEEKDKTEYEKMKHKLDKWLKTVTTAQLLKAKELSLKELGEEDRLQSQWWSTLQPCRYLRQRSSLQ